MGQIDVLDIKWPLSGLYRQVGYQSQEPYSTTSCLNVRNPDVFLQRLRGGSRPGLAQILPPKSTEITPPDDGPQAFGPTDFYPTKDVFIQGHAAGTNYSTTASDFVRSFSGGSLVTRFLMHFDFGIIPATATITSATMYFYNHNNTQAPLATLCKAKRLTQTGWVESQVTWNSYATASSWTSPGGDATATDEVSWNLRVVLTDGWHEITGFETLVTTALGLAGGDAKQLHLLFKIDDEAAVPGSTTYRNTFRAEDYSDTSLRPKMTMEWTVP